MRALSSSSLAHTSRIQIQTLLHHAIKQTDHRHTRDACTECRNTAGTARLTLPRRVPLLPVAEMRVEVMEPVCVRSCPAVSSVPRPVKLVVTKQVFRRVCTGLKESLTVPLEDKVPGEHAHAHAQGRNYYLVFPRARCWPLNGTAWMCNYCCQSHSLFSQGHQSYDRASTRVSSATSV
jgi:hypothetical protein